ncbi:MAG: FkbM family methyltransferase [Pirellulales bacterium]
MQRIRQHMTWLYRAWRYRLLVERPEVRFVLEHLRPGDIAIDIGAHKGAFLYWMQRAVGRDGRVVAFEPQPELAQYLRSLASDRGLDHVRVVNAALSHHPGVMTLTRAGELPSPGARLHPDEVREEGIAGHVSFAVRVEALDKFLTQSDRPVRLIKCDVEGHELAVFRGARRILEEDQPLLLFECERRHHHGASIAPVFEYLQELGYSGAYLDEQREQPLSAFRPEFQDDPRSKSYVNNFVFTPRRLAATELRKVA